MDAQIIEVYTDGSCHTQLKIGTWATIIFVNTKKIVLQGSEKNTTHNRMELLGIIKSIECLEKENLQHEQIHIFSDSQYAVNLEQRKERLEKKSFMTKKGQAIRNSDLVMRLMAYSKAYAITYVKVKAHSIDGNKLNREVDALVRTSLRKIVQHEQSAI